MNDREMVAVIVLVGTKHRRDGSELHTQAFASRISCDAQL
jgi:hypothetical protein